MAFLAREDPADMVVCPYDDSHVISHRRYQYHVTACKKVGINSWLNNKMVKLVIELCAVRAYDVRSEDGSVL